MSGRSHDLVFGVRHRGGGATNYILSRNLVLRICQALPVLGFKGAPFGADDVYTGDFPRVNIGDVPHFFTGTLPVFTENQPLYVRNPDGIRRIQLNYSVNIHDREDSHPEPAYQP